MTEFAGVAKWQTHHLEGVALTRRGGSSPPSRTKKENRKVLLFLFSWPGGFPLCGILLRSTSSPLPHEKGESEGSPFFIFPARGFPAVRDFTVFNKSPLPHKIKGGSDRSSFLFSWLCSFPLCGISLRSTSPPSRNSALSFLRRQES